MDCLLFYFNESIAQDFHFVNKKIARRFGFFQSSSLYIIYIEKRFVLAFFGTVSTRKHSFGGGRKNRKKI
jgi:hypothetical protein